MQLDEQIRDALAREASTIPSAAVERLRRIDYRPRRRALTPPLAAGALAAAGATAGTLLALGGAGSQEAFAGWSATPTSTRVGHASAVEAKCTARVGARAQRSSTRALPSSEARPTGTVASSSARI